MDKYLVYLAGPITGLKYDESVDWRDEAIWQLGQYDIIGLSPMRCKDYLSKEDSVRDSYDEHVMSSSRGIITRDYNDCRRCDALIVNVLGAQKVSIGTVMEIAWAKAFSKPVILVSEDENIHNHSMINECVGFRVKMVEEAVQVAVALLQA